MTREKKIADTIQQIDEQEKSKELLISDRVSMLLRSSSSQSAFVCLSAQRERYENNKKNFWPSLGCESLLNVVTVSLTFGAGLGMGVFQNQIPWFVYALSIGAIEGALVYQALPKRRFLSALKSITKSYEIPVQRRKGISWRKRIDAYSKAITEPKEKFDALIQECDAKISNKYNEIENSRSKLRSLSLADNTIDLLDFGSVRLFHEKPYLDTKPLETWKQNNPEFFKRPLVKTIGTERRH